MKINKEFKKVLGLSVLTMLMAMVLSPVVNAGRLQSVKVVPNDTTPGQSAVTHSFEFTIPSSTSLEEIRILYCTAASGTCSTPTGFDVGASASLSNATGVLSDWTLDTTNSPSGGHTVVLHYAVDGTANDSIAANSVVSFDVTQLTNPATSNDCDGDGDTSADSCFVRITTYEDDNATGAVDSSTATVTVVTDVTVSATVDPLFRFVVGGVDTASVHNEITTSVSTTYNTLPFGNLTAGTPKYAAHSLTVTTNTQNGYSITSEMVTQMQGVYSGNNIDPYDNGSTWSSPTAWAEPTGTTPNVDTGWIGANTTDTDVSGWNSSPEGKFGPISSTAVTVMSSTTSDNGGTPVYVSYALEANVYQPADTYTGTLQYTALPSY